MIICVNPFYEHMLICQTRRREGSKQWIIYHCLYIHIFSPRDGIGSSLPLFFGLFLSLLPAFIGMIISFQFMPTDWTRIVLILQVHSTASIQAVACGAQLTEKKNFYQPRFEARRMKHVSAGQLLHFIINH